MSDSDPSLSNPAPLPPGLSNPDLPLPGTLAPWRSPLARALHRNRSRPYSRYLQLATVTAEGRPANRTVVFRGWLPQGNTLTLVTDRRSAKVGEIALTPWVEACWYFTHTREQFRLAGTAQVVAGDDPTHGQAHQQAWETLSDGARQQFYWPTPAQPRSPTAGFAPQEGAIAPPANFCLLLLTPATVDHLELRGEPQNRTLYRCRGDGTWHSEAVNP